MQHSLSSVPSLRNKEPLSKCEKWPPRYEVHTGGGVEKYLKFADKRYREGEGMGQEILWFRLSYMDGPKTFFFKVRSNWPKIYPVSSNVSSAGITKPLPEKFALPGKLNSLTSQFWLHSQCESRKVRTVASAASAPLTLDRMRPSRCGLRITRTFWILDSSSPSLAAKGNREHHILAHSVNKRLWEQN